MWTFLTSIFTGGLGALFGVFGKTITDIHADNTTRFRNENDAGNQLATTTADASVKSAMIRADLVVSMRLKSVCTRRTASRTLTITCWRML